MLKYKLDCVVENKTVQVSDIRNQGSDISLKPDTQNLKPDTYTAYVLLCDDIAPDVILAKFCLSYTTQNDFEEALRDAVKRYKTVNLNIDAVKTKVKESLIKIEKEE